MGRSSSFGRRGRSPSLRTHSMRASCCFQQGLCQSLLCRGHLWCWRWRLCSCWCAARRLSSKRSGQRLPPTRRRRAPRVGAFASSCFEAGSWMRPFRECPSDSAPLRMGRRAWDRVLGGCLVSDASALGALDVLRASRRTDSGAKSFFAILKTHPLPVCQRMPTNGVFGRFLTLQVRGGLCFVSWLLGCGFPAVDHPGLEGLGRTRGKSGSFFFEAGSASSLMSGCESPESPTPIVSSLEARALSSTHDCNMGAAALFARGLKSLSPVGACAHFVTHVTSAGA